MKRPLEMTLAILFVLGILVISVAGATPAAPKDKDKTAARMLTGKVLDKRDNPVVNAVVYLSNTRSHAVKTYIVGPDGSYRFPELASNVDFEVYAQYKDSKSDTKTVSQFDTRPTVNINLKIETK